MVSAGPPCAAANGLQITLEFAFLDHSLVRLVKALDAILTIIAFGRKQLCDLVDAACRAGAMDTRAVKHALSDPELMIAQVILRRKLRGSGPLAAEMPPFPFMLKSITEIDLKGIVLMPAEATSLFGT